MGCGGSKEAADEPKVQHIPATSLNALLPKGHERLGSLLLTLEHQAAADTQKWLQMIDEERSARKAIESASGKSFDEFRAWVAIVEESLSEGIVSLAQLEEAWQVQGSAAKAAAVPSRDGRFRRGKASFPPEEQGEEGSEGSDVPTVMPWIDQKVPRNAMSRRGGLRRERSKRASAQKSE